MTFIDLIMPGVESSTLLLNPSGMAKDDLKHMYNQFVASLVQQIKAQWQ